MSFKTTPPQYAKGVAEGIGNISKLSLGGFILVLQLFLLVTAQNSFSNPAVRDVIDIYLMLLVLCFVVLNQDINFMKINVYDGLSQIFVFFLAGIIIFSLIYSQDILPSTNYAGFGTATMLIIAQLFVIAYTEEGVFRGALPRIFDKSNMSPNAARITSAAAFASFHMYIYNFSLLLIGSAFVFGLTMQYVWDGGDVEGKKQGYPLGAVGLHAAWNVVAIAGPFALFQLVGA